MADAEDIREKCEQGMRPVAQPEGDGGGGILTTLPDHVVPSSIICVSAFYKAFNENKQTDPSFYPLLLDISIPHPPTPSSFRTR